jgi:hypothetical protein
MVDAVLVAFVVVAPVVAAVRRLLGLCPLLALDAVDVCLEGRGLLGRDGRRRLDVSTRSDHGPDGQTTTYSGDVTRSDSGNSNGRDIADDEAEGGTNDGVMTT